ncbi:MAG TPA: FAD-binding oxidoreductase [Candidatus Saccharibacteria bacterium]|nr:FAD-binding oxidoreductase [Candidatus Saccharibacteria bacterium]
MLIDPYDFRPARITRLIRHAARAISIQLATDQPYDFKVGQHAIVRVTLPDGTKLVRQYSFSSPANDQAIWLTIIHTPEGAVSGWFNERAKEGDTVEISRPFSGPLMQKIPRGEICIIAGGSGIAPVIAWVRALRTKQQGFTLLYSTRHDELCFPDELTPLRTTEKITIRLTDREPRLTKQDIIDALTPTATVFICGSRPFVLAMHKYCETVVPPDAIHAEAFSL